MNTLIHMIEEEYDLKIVRYEVMRDSGKSLVVVLHTPKAKYLGKSLFTTAERQDFILDAEEYLRKKGIAIPNVKRTKDRRRYIFWNRSPFLIQEWASGPMLALNSPARLRRTGSTLGKIHAASLGFSSPLSDDFNASSTWEEEYEKDLASMKLWKDQHATCTDSKHAMIVWHLPFFLIAGKIAADSLHHSSYFQKWKQLPCSEHFLCHGDFNNGNLLSTKQKITVIDWEDVRYDFPSKDISRVLSLLMRKDGDWDRHGFRQLMKGYLRENPLTRRQRHLLYVDLAFPHITERFLRQKQYLDMTENEIRQFLKREIKKSAYMLEKMRALE